MAGKRSGTEPTVVLVGRPNVGKSTLFNRITGTRRAIVTPMAGTTRDVIAQQAEWLDTTFTLVDTGGLFGASLDPLHELVVKHGQRAIQSADVDCLRGGRQGRAGLGRPGDRETVEAGRRPVVLAVNKTDVKRAERQDFYQLGIEPMVSIAAEHGQGIGDLLEEVVGRLKARACVSRPRRARAEGRVADANAKAKTDGERGRRRDVGWSDSDSDSDAGLSESDADSDSGPGGGVTWPSIPAPPHGAVPQHRDAHDPRPRAGRVWRGGADGGGEPAGRRA